MARIGFNQHAQNQLVLAFDFKSHIFCIFLVIFQKEEVKLSYKRFINTKYIY